MYGDRSHPAREPSGDLLNQPQIPVGVAERTEGPVTGALGVRAGLPRLDWERRAVPHVSHIDTKGDEPVMSHLDVRDGEAALG